METKKNDVMKYEAILPEDFDGTFRFTNWTDEDFVGVWGSKEYRFAAQTTSPILIADHSPLEIQSIRKKFAKDLAEREFFKSKKYETLRFREGPIDEMGMIQPRGSGMSHAGQYSIDDLAPFIKQCLTPLTVAKAAVTQVERQPLEDKLSKNEEGDINTKAIDLKTSLKKKALEA